MHLVSQQLICRPDHNTKSPRTRARLIKHRRGIRFIQINREGTKVASQKTC